MVAAVPITGAAQGLGGAAAREKQRLSKTERSGPARVFTDDELRAQGGRTPWKSPDASFQIAFPGVPESKASESGGTTYRLVSSGTLFSVNVRELTADQVAQAFDDYRAAALRSLRDAALVSETAVTSGDTGGREIVVSFSRSHGGQGVMRARAFVAGLRLYSLVVMASPGHENDGEVQQFLDSFRALARP